MLTAYLDESGHQTNGWMFVAGFLGNEDQWENLAKLWREALGPQRQHLHVKELRFRKERDRKLLARLGPIPEQCGLRPVLGGVRFADYQDLVEGTPGEKFLKGYIACIYPLIINVLRTIPRNERVQIFFERQDEYKPHADQVLSALSGIKHHQTEWFLTESGEQKLAKWSFISKDSTVLTEPADLFAYGLLHLCLDPTSVRSKWCEPILKSGNGEGVGAIMTRDQIRAVISQTPIAALYLQVLKRLGGGA